MTWGVSARNTVQSHSLSFEPRSESALTSDRFIVFSHDASLPGRPLIDIVFDPCEDTQWVVSELERRAMESIGTRQQSERIQPE